MIPSVVTGRTGVSTLISICGKEGTILVAVLVVTVKVVVAVGLIKGSSGASSGSSSSSSSSSSSCSSRSCSSISSSRRSSSSSGSSSSGNDLSPVQTSRNVSFFYLSVYLSSGATDGIVGHLPLSAIVDGIGVHLLLLQSDS